MYLSINDFYGSVNVWYFSLGVVPNSVSFSNWFNWEHPSYSIPERSALDTPGWYSSSDVLPSLVMPLTWLKGQHSIHQVDTLPRMSCLPSWCLLHDWKVSTRYTRLILFLGCLALPCDASYMTERSALDTPGWYSSSDVLPSLVMPLTWLKGQHSIHQVDTLPRMSCPPSWCLLHDSVVATSCAVMFL